MKTLPQILALAAVVLSLAGRAPAQPASASDSLYLEDFRQGVSQSVNVVWLKADGTYEVLSNDSRTTSNGVATPLGETIAGKGSYTYTASPADQTATLVLGGTTRTLQFRGTTSGVLLKNLPAGMFELLPRGPVNPRANVALRGRVQGGSGPIAGLVTTDIQWVLIRAVGPGLAKFGVTSPASSPTFTLVSNGFTRFTKAGWDTPNHEAETTFQLVGAFPLDRGSADAALLVRLDRGNHTIDAHTTGTDGDVLIEVYYLPFNY